MRWCLVTALTISIVLPQSAGADQIDFKRPKAEVRAALLQRVAVFADVNAAKRFLTTEGFACLTSDQNFLTRTRVLARSHLYCTRTVDGNRSVTVWHIGILHLHGGVTGVVVVPETIYM